MPEGLPETGADTPSPATEQVLGAVGISDVAERPLSELSAAVRELADAAERYHDRAVQRESVIDYLRSELETLRRGERRVLLRPLLTEICRLRNDLLRQAATLPPDFDTEQAAKLLVSFAETVEIALENNGVASDAPEEGDLFDPRAHRRLRSLESDDPSLAGRIAQVLRDGYIDVETNGSLVPAEVNVFVAVKESK